MISSSLIIVWLSVVSVPFLKRSWFKNSVAFTYKTFSRKKKELTFLSLPDEIVLNCLACISRSYYPKLSLVCKTFRSLIVSRELAVARLHLKTYEPTFIVCLQFPDIPRPSFFTLWTKPGQILTNQLEKNERTTGNTRLVRVPSSYYSGVPRYVVKVGSEWYGLDQYNDPSSIMWVHNKESMFWRKTPNMYVARANARAVFFNGKIYVMGGCAANESANWGEVFDPKTQTWEPLPDPGVELSFSSIRKIEVIQGKLYVRSNEEKDSCYDPKERKWDVTEKSPPQCVIGNLRCYCDKNGCWWYDTNRHEWRVVRGLDMLNMNLGCGMIETANYGGKLLILWDKFVHDSPCQDKDIWCVVIALENVMVLMKFGETLSGLILCLPFQAHMFS